MRNARRGSGRSHTAPRSWVAVRLLALVALATVLLGWEGLGFAGVAQQAQWRHAGADVAPPVEPREGDARIHAPSGPVDERAVLASDTLAPSPILQPRGHQRWDWKPAELGVPDLFSSTQGPGAVAALLQSVDGARVAELLERVLESRGEREANPARGPPPRLAALT